MYTSISNAIATADSFISGTMVHFLLSFSFCFGEAVSGCHFFIIGYAMVLAPEIEMSRKLITRNESEKKFQDTVMKIEYSTPKD